MQNSSPSVTGTVQNSSPSGAGTVQNSSPSGAGTEKSSSPSGAGTVQNSSPLGAGAELNSSQSGDGAEQNPIPQMRQLPKGCKRIRIRIRKELQDDLSMAYKPKLNKYKVMPQKDSKTYHYCHNNYCLAIKISEEQGDQFTINYKVWSDH